VQYYTYQSNLGRYYRYCIFNIGTIVYMFISIYMVSYIDIGTYKKCWTFFMKLFCIRIYIDFTNCLRILGALINHTNIFFVFYRCADYIYNSAPILIYKLTALVYYRTAPLRKLCSLRVVNNNNKIGQIRLCYTSL